jgi:hypothetical protein
MQCSVKKFRRRGRLLMLIVFDNIVDMATGSAFSILTGDVENSIPAITVTGKAFFDAGHSVKDQRLEAIFRATQPGRFIRW